MMNQDAVPRRRDVIKYAILTTLLALAVLCEVAALFDLPELVPATAILGLAWYSYRTCRVSPVGTVLGTMALELVTAIVSLTYHSVGDIFDDLMFFSLLSILAIAFMLASVIAFLVRAYLSRERRRPNQLAAAAACLLPIVWFAVGNPAAAELREWALQREIAQGEIPAFIADLTRLTDLLGRAPNDKEELVQLLGKPLPSVSRGGIRYQHSGGKHFALTFGYDLGYYVFDSQEPERGWHRYWPEHRPARALKGSQ
jgi:hypothetical protein